MLTFGVVGHRAGQQRLPALGQRLRGHRVPGVERQHPPHRQRLGGNFSFFLAQPALPPRDLRPDHGPDRQRLRHDAPLRNGPRLDFRPRLRPQQWQQRRYGALPTDIAFAVGTNPNNAYTIAAGIDDFTRIVINHASSLSGTPLTTGIVATLPLSGDAEDVTLAGSTNTTGGQTAYVATGSYGLAIVNASTVQQPVLLGQVQLPGDSIGVAVDPQLNIAAVASTTALNLVNVSNPGIPKLLQSVDIPAEAVKVSNGVAYVANGDQVTMVDMVSGDTLDNETFSGGTIDDLSITQDARYVLAP